MGGGVGRAGGGEGGLHLLRVPLLPYHSQKIWTPLDVPGTPHTPAWVYRVTPPPTWVYNESMICKERNHQMMDTQWFL